LPEILGHDQVWDRFRRSLDRGRLASTFLFVGPHGIGKRGTAMRLAQCLLCETTPAEDLHACGSCPSCQQVAALTHPDLIVIGKPEDKSFIPVECFIGDREHRMREGLCHDIALKPFRGGRRIAIIDDADFLNQEGANCLLKTLEEPPPQSLIILIGSSEQRQLPTIRSRCQIVRFAPLPPPLVAELLTRQNHVDAAQAHSVAVRCGGSLTRALELCDPELEQTRGTLLEQLCRLDFDSLTLATTVTGFVEAAGKDAPPRRARLRQVVEMAADFYRAVMRQSAQTGPSGDPLIDQLVAAACQAWGGNPVVAAACLDRCLDAQQQIDANANLPTLVPSWIDDLAELSRGACL
jgi:DNA polymerase-3 subunit delta'